MSAITDIWRQLVRRRLWPVAIILLGALVAVPVMLSKSPAPAPAAPAVPTTDTKEDVLAAKPVVELASTGSTRRHVLGTRKDPFAPGKQPKVKELGTSSSTGAGTPTSTAKVSTATPTSGSNGTTGSTGSTGSTPSTPSSAPPSAPSTPPSASTPPPASTPPAKKPTYPLYSIVVRFGDASADSLPKSRLKRLDPLPDATNPVAVYLGPGKDKKSAVFLVDSSVTPQGDGQCKPYAADCQTVVLHEGETEFFDTKDDQGNVISTAELDLVSITRKTTTSARRAKAAARPSKAGKRVVRRQVAAQGPLAWAYDRANGTVAKLDKQAWEAGVRQAAAQVAQLVSALKPAE